MAMDFCFQLLVTKENTRIRWYMKTTMEDLAFADDAIRRVHTQANLDHLNETGK